MPAKLWCSLVACGKRRNCVTTNIALHNGHKEYRVISRWQSVVASCCCTSLVTDDVVKWIFLCRCYGRKTFSALQDCSCTWRFVTLWHIQRHVDVYLAPWPLKVKGNERRWSELHNGRKVHRVISRLQSIVASCRRSKLVTVHSVSLLFGL